MSSNYPETPASTPHNNPTDMDVLHRLMIQAGMKPTTHHLAAPPSPEWEIATTPTPVHVTDPYFEDRWAYRYENSPPPAPLHLDLITEVPTRHDRVARLARRVGVVAMTALATAGIWTTLNVIGQQNAH